MKKKWNYGGCRCPIIATKLFRIMKLTTFLMVIMLVHATAAGYSQMARLTLTGKNVALGEVFKQIEEQSEFSFFYNVRQVDLDMRVDVNFENQLVEKILNDVLSETNLTFSVNNRLIVIHQKNLTEKTLSELQQPQNMVGGKVTDERGNPLPGVTVAVKGKTQGTVTDVNGNYSLSNVQPDAVLVFSFVGMKMQEIAVAGKKVIDIALAEDAIGIEEVVAIGYGTAKKSDLTGSVSTLQGQKIAERNTSQVSTALQGAVAGLLVTRSSSAPGAKADLLIRGITSINGSSPLIIVDNVPSDLSLVNPDDIEDISVLKDAASASIYGARAASGVILITTKRAKENELSLNYSYEYGLNYPTSRIQNVGIQRYLEMVNELRYNDNPGNGLYQTYTQDQVDNWVEKNISDPDNYPITNWYDVMVKEVTPKQNHTLSLTGGSKNVKTKASLRYDKEDGLFKVGSNEKYEHYILRVNNDFAISKQLSASLDINVKYAITSEPSRSGIWSQIRTMPSIYPYKWENGGLAQFKNGYNIYGWITEGGTLQRKFANLGGKLTVNFTPLKGMKITAIASPNFSYSNSKRFVKQCGPVAMDDPNTIIGNFAGYENTKLTEGRNNNNDLTTQLIAVYSNSIGKHNFNLMAGNENYHFFQEALSASRDKYELKEYPYLNVGPRTIIDNSGSGSEFAYRSFFGRLMYNYADKYLIQGNIRFDNSSRFAPDYRLGVFPSVSVGWVLSNESFLKDYSNISFLKLRASLGSLGNERIGNYPYQATLEFHSSLFYDTPASSLPTFYNSAAQTTYAINDISWETTTSYDLGIDAYFFNNRLRFVGDYYKKTTKDMLLTLDIPAFVGFEKPSQNAGKMFTNGVDFELAWNDHKGDWGYGISANLSNFVSKMGNLGGTQFLGDKVKFEGSEFDEWYGYLSDGLFLTQEDLDNSAKVNSNIKVGDVKYRDITGPDGVPDGVISPEYDRVLLGGSLPRCTYGGNLFASYNDWDISLSFQGVGSQNTRLTSPMIMPMRDDWGDIPAIIDNNYWSSFKTDEENEKAKYPRLTNTNKSTNIVMSDFWMFNGRYFRLKNATLGYTVPALITKKININSIRLYISGSDLFCLHGYPSGWDPERNGDSYPITTTLLFGASINF